MAFDDRQHRFAVSGRSLAGEALTSVGHRPKARSSADIAFVDLSMTSGVARRVSIRTT